MSNEKKRLQVNLNLHVIQGHLAFSLECFGDHLAKREKYKEHTGMEAVYFYLIQKYRWLPAKVRSLNLDDLRFLMAEEMHGWALPEEARGLKYDYK